MAAREVRRGSDVDHRIAAAQGSLYVVQIELAQRSGGHRRRTVAVDRFHPREVLRRLGLVLEDGFDEQLLVLDLEGPVGETLVAKRGRGQCTERFAASRAGAVAGPELQVRGQVGRRADRAEEATSERVHRAGMAGRALEEVGPAYVADEDEVARKHARRRVSGERVGDDEADVLGRVPRGMSHREAHAADIERVMVVEPSRVEPVLPVGVALAGEEKRCAGADREVARPRNEVGVDVRLGDFLDVHLAMLGRIDEALDIASGIDDDRGLRFLAADQIGSLGESFVVDPFEQHRWEG